MLTFDVDRSVVTEYLKKILYGQNMGQNVALLWDSQAGSFHHLFRLETHSKSLWTHFPEVRTAMSLS